MRFGRPTIWRCISCAYSSQVLRAGSVRPSLPSSSARAISPSGSLAQMPRPRPSSRPEPNVHRGTLDDLDILGSGAAASEGVIHLAFKHEIAFAGDFQGAADAIAARSRQSARRLRGLIGRSSSPRARLGSHPGVWRPSGTDTVPTRLWPVWRAVPRPGGHRRVGALPRFPGRRSSVVRLPPTNHGDGDNGFIATLIAIAARRASPATSARAPTAGLPCIGSIRRASSASRWKGPPRDRPCTGRRRGRSGSRDRRGHRTPSRPPGRLHRPRGCRRALFLACRLLCGRQPSLQRADRELLGWQPTHSGLIADLDEEHYFQESIRCRLIETTESHCEEHAACSKY